MRRTVPDIARIEREMRMREFLLILGLLMGILAAFTGIAYLAACLAIFLVRGGRRLALAAWRDVRLIVSAGLRN